MITKDIRLMNDKIDEFFKELLKTIPMLVESQERLNKKLDKLLKEKENK